METTKNLEDEYKWALETAAAVRAGNFNAIDREALINELERSVAGGFRRQLHQYTRDALRARLSLKLTPDSGREENVDLFRRALDRMGSLLRACPSLRDVVT